MREREAAKLLEEAIGSHDSGRAALDDDLRTRVNVAEALEALDLARESRVREPLRGRLARDIEETGALPVVRSRRGRWVARHPVLAAELGVLLVVALLAVVAPRSLAAIVEPVVRFVVVEMIRVGEHTQIQRYAPQTAADLDAALAEHQTRIRSGKSWFVNTPYGGYGGSVPPGEAARVRRVTRLDVFRSVTPATLRVPDGLYRGEPVRFHHADVTPGGNMLIFFGSGDAELFVSAFPVGEGRSVGFSRSVDRTTPDGEVVTEDPPLQTEEMSLDGLAVVWDPDPDPPSRGPAYVFMPGSWPPLQRRAASSALRWEEDGVSYSLMGRSLARDEAVELFFSRRPLDEVE